MENENDVTDAESDSEQNQIETGDERTEREEDGENENGTFDDSPVTSESIDFDEMNIELQSLQRIQTNSDDESDDEFQITSSNQRSSRLILPNQFRCLAHLLNLVATTWFKKKLQSGSQNNFKAYNDLLEKAKRLWRPLRRSPLAHSLCQDICGCQLPIPIDVRWNSEFNAFKKLLENKTSVIFEPNCFFFHFFFHLSIDI